MTILELGKFYPPYRGGMESLLRVWAEGFAQRGARVECVVANGRARTSHEEVGGVRVHRLASWGSWWSASLCPAYLLSPWRYPADLWHVHFPNPLADLAAWLGPRRAPLVLHYHSDVVRQAGVLRLYAPLLRWLLRRAARIVVASPQQIQFSPWLQAHREKCEVIPFGVELERFALTPARTAAVAALRRQAGDQPVLLHIGRLVEYKGQRHLIEAARGLAAVVWLVGEGPLRIPLEARARALGVGERLIFWGDQSDEMLVTLLHACDVFVLPSVTANEAFGLVQLEAMACAKPVVSTALPSGVASVNLDGVTGLVVPPAEPAALATALRRLLDDPAGRVALGRAGRSRVEAEFNQTAMIQRYWALLQRVLEQRQRP